MKGGVRLEIRKVDWACVGEKPEHETLSLSCKVAAPGDERYLVCAAGAVRSFWCVISSCSVFCSEWLFMCVVLCVCCIRGCRSQCNGCMNLAWGLCLGESRSRKPCVFPCKDTSCLRRVRSVRFGV